MTREEAHTLLEVMAIELTGELADIECPVTERTKLLGKQLEAIDMAIEALSAEAQAKCIAEIKVDAEDIYTRITGLVADKVDVVRCEDCRHRDLFSCPLADNDFQKDEDFCSWGERREE